MPGVWIREDFKLVKVVQTRSTRLSTKPWHFGLKQRQRDELTASYHLLLLLCMAAASTSISNLCGALSLTITTWSLTTAEARTNFTSMVYPNEIMCQFMRGQSKSLRVLKREGYMFPSKGLKFWIPNIVEVNYLDRLLQCCQFCSV